MLAWALHRSARGTHLAAAAEVPALGGADTGASAKEEQEEAAAAAAAAGTPALQAALVAACRGGDRAAMAALLAAGADANAGVEVNEGFVAFGTASTLKRHISAVHLKMKRIRGTR
jgi:hypothetical protein